MKPAPFTLHRPTSLREAEMLVAEHGDEAKALAGGQSLVPMLALRLTRFEHLVDLNGVDELRGIGDHDAGFRIGAGVRQATVGADPTIAAAVPLLARATPLIGHFQIRNRGTIGGSLAHADPASEYPAVAVALDAWMEVTRASGTWLVQADEFFTGTWTTKLESDELLAGIIVPPHSGRRGVAIDEVARRHGDFALAGATAVIDIDADDRVRHAAIAMFGMGSTPVRAPAAEEALTGHTRAELDLTEIAQLAVRDADPPNDVHASATYRRRAGAHLVERVLAQALEEATSAAR